MKNKVSFKVTSLFLITVILCCLVSCSVDSTDNNINFQENYDQVLIDDITENYIIGVSQQYNTKVSIPNWFSNDVTIAIGEIVKVSHDGNLQETYPAQYHKIYSMSYQKPDGELVTQYPAPENITPDDQPNLTVTYAYIEFYIGDTCVQKYTSKDDAKILFDNLQNMKDGTEFICNCLPDYTIVVNGNEYAYCSKTGVVVDMQLLKYYVINNKDAVNKIIEEYKVEYI